MKKKFLLGVFLLFGFLFVLTSCNKSSSEAKIVSVDGGTIDGSSIYLFVDEDTESVLLTDIIECSDNSTWKLYFDKLGLVEIPTRIATSQNGSLVDGENNFYIVVSSVDGLTFNTYELTIYRAYLATINYYNGSYLLKSELVETGQEYTADYIPDIEGYTFNGWVTSDGETYTTGMLLEDLDLYAVKAANSYKITLDKNMEEDTSTSSQSVIYGEFFELPVPTRTGYTFLGWYVNNQRITDSSGYSLSPYMYTKNVKAVAKWESRTYTVSLNRNNTEAGIVSGSGEYDYGETVTISANTYLGYEFMGWYDENDNLVSTEEKYTFKIGSNDLNYTAKWRVKEEMEKFYFTSNLSTCEITDLKDYSMTDLTIPSYVTSIKSYAFDGATNLTSVKILEGLTYIGSYAFNDCSNLIEVVVPKSVTQIGSGAFSGCGSLVSMTLPFVGGNAYATSASSSTLFGYIFGASSFYGSTSITQYYSSYSSKTYCIPTCLKTVTITGGNINYGSFYNCSNLTSITLPSSLTSIGDKAFYNCSSLTSITIPDSVTSIGQNAFYGSTNLASVTFEDTANWYVSSSSSSYQGTALTSECLANEESAATCLKTTYVSYYWTKTN